MISNRVVGILIVVVTSLLASGDAVDDTVEQIRLTASKGETVELRCRKLGTKKPIVAQWKYKKSGGEAALRVTFNRRVMPRFRRRFVVKSTNDSSEDVFDFSLIIRAVIRDDAGVYTCLVSDQSAELQSSVRLDVTEAAILLKARVGSDVTLPCNSTFLNPVEWTYRNPVSKSISTLVKRDRENASRDDVARFRVENFSNLVISDVTVTDAGLYFCTEDDGFGAKHPVYLTVLNDGDGVPWPGTQTEFQDKVGFVIEDYEQSLTKDGHPIASQVLEPFPLIKQVQSFNWQWILLLVIGFITVIGFMVIVKVTCTCQQRPSVRRVDDGGSDTESSMDDLTLLNNPQQQQQRTPHRGRLYAVSDDVDDVCSSNVESHDAPAAHSSKPAITKTQAQAFPVLGVMGLESPALSKPSSEPVVVEPQLQVSPRTGTSSVGELKSQAIPGPTTDHGELEIQSQVVLGPGSVRAAVRSEAAVPASVIVVHATVEHQPLASADDS